MRVVLVIAPRDFRDEELFVPMEVLSNSGVECTIASKQKGVCVGMLGAEAKASISLSEVGNDFDGVVFIGGLGAEDFFKDALALGLALKFFDMKKLVGAICIAPRILANAGVLKGKRATSSVSEKEILLSKGANFTGKDVEVDGRVVTASGPSSVKRFGEALLKVLKEK